jgi:hypothetical protein
MRVYGSLRGKPVYKEESDIIVEGGTIDRESTGLYPIGSISAKLEKKFNSKNTMIDSPGVNNSEEDNNFLRSTNDPVNNLINYCLH